MFVRALQIKNLHVEAEALLQEVEVKGETDPETISSFRALNIRRMYLVCVQLAHFYWKMSPDPMEFNKEVN